MRLKTLPLDLLDEPTFDVRLYLVSEELDELGDSIQRVGLLKPIRVFEKNGRYEIEDGHRRFLAAKRKGIQKLPCLIVKSGERDRDLKKLEANLHGANVTPIETSRTLHRLKDEYDYSVEDLCKAIGKSQGRVSQLLALMNYPEEIRTCLEDRRISEHIARALMRIKDPERRLYYLNYTMDSGATIDTVRAWAAREEIWSQQSEPPARLDPNQAPPPDVTIIKARCQCCRVDYKQDGLMFLKVCPDCYPELTALLPDLWKAIKQERAQAESTEGGKDEPYP